MNKSFEDFLEYYYDISDPDLQHPYKLYSNIELSLYDKETQIRFCFYKLLFKSGIPDSMVYEILEHHLNQYNGTKNDFRNFIKYTISIIPGLKTSPLFEESNVFPAKTTERRKEIITNWANANQKRSMITKKFVDFFVEEVATVEQKKALVEELVAKFNWKSGKEIGFMIIALSEYKVLRIRKGDYTQLHNALKQEVKEIATYQACFNKWQNPKFHNCNRYQKEFNAIREKVKQCINNVLIIL